MTTSISTMAVWAHREKNMYSCIWVARWAGMATSFLSRWMGVPAVVAELCEKHNTGGKRGKRFLGKRAVRRGEGSREVRKVRKGGEGADFSRMRVCLTWELVAASRCKTSHWRKKGLRGGGGMVGWCGMDGTEVRMTRSAA